MSKIIEKPWGHQIQLDSGEVLNVVKNRRLYVCDEDFSLNADTLVGSAFLVLVDEEIIWTGVIVAEPETGRYLCELDKLTQGAEHCQRVFSLDTIMGLGDEGRRLLEGSYGDAKAPVIDPHIEWRLYDSVAQAREAFEAWHLSHADMVLEQQPDELPSLDEDWPVHEQKPEPEPKKKRAPAKRTSSRRRGVK